jgi:hypothetical protein
VPDEVRRGKSYSIDYEFTPTGGVALDAFVRIMNKKTGNFVDCPITEHSKNCKEHCTKFHVPENIECGKSKLTLIVNNTPSKSISLDVKRH